MKDLTQSGQIVVDDDRVVGPPTEWRGPQITQSWWSPNMHFKHWDSVEEISDVEV